MPHFIAANWKEQKWLVARTLFSSINWPRMNEYLIYIIFGGLAIAVLMHAVPLSLLVAAGVGYLLFILWQKNMRS